MRQPRNVDGLPVNRKGGIDARAFNPGRPRKIVVGYFIREKPGDSKPWHVMRPGTAEEPPVRLTRHHTLRRAQMALERFRSQ